MRARIAGVNLNRQQTQVTPIGDFDIGNKLPTNRIGDEIRYPLFCLEDIADTANPSRAVLEEILRLYPYIKQEDITQALGYAAWRSEEREVQLKSA